MKEKTTHKLSFTKILFFHFRINAAVEEVFTPFTNTTIKQYSNYSKNVNLN